MTQRTKTALQTNLNADLADNTSGDISAEDVRGNLIDFTDSVPFLASATNVVSGSFSGSFEGDGSNLTGVTGEWDGSLNGNASITGSLTVSGGITGTVTTASYVETAQTASYITSAISASSTPNALTTASVSLNTITFTKGDASTFNITVDTGSAGGGGSTFPYTGSADITGSLTVEGPTVLSGSLDVSGSVTIGRLGGAGHDLGIYSINTASFQIDYLDMEVYTDTTIDAYSFGSTVSNFEIKNTAQYGGTKGYIKLDAGNLYLTGSTINSTGTWTHADDLTIQEGVEISGSLGLTGSFTIGRADGSPDYDLGVYQIATASIQADYLDMDLYESTLIKPTSVGSTQGNFEIRNRALFGGTKGYIKLDAGDLYLTGSTINSTGTWTHASDFIVAGNTTLGDVITDTTTVTGSLEISGSTNIVGDFTVDKSSGASYNSTTGSILVANLELLGNEFALMRGRANTEIRGESFYDANTALPGNINIANTLGFGSTKGYTKIDAGDVIISGSAVYIDPNSLPTTEPSDSGQLWLSGSAGSDSKVLCVRD